MTIHMLVFISKDILNIELSHFSVTYDIVMVSDTHSTLHSDLLNLTS